jgi:hypothetical protein
MPNKQYSLYTTDSIVQKIYNIIVEDNKEGGEPSWHFQGNHELRAQPTYRWTSTIHTVIGSKIDNNVTYANWLVIILRYHPSTMLYCIVAFYSCFNHILLYKTWRHNKHNFKFSPIKVEVRFSFSIAWMTIAYLW